MVAFYNQGDQNIYKDFQYVPQEKYRLGFTAPTPSVEEQKITQTFGIPATNAFTNSGNSFNQSGNAFGYGSPVNEVNVRTFNPQSNDPTGSVANAQTMYNKASNAGPMVETFSGMRPSENVMDYYGGQIMNNREQYGAQGQYNSPYDDTVDLGFRGRDTSTSLEGSIGKDGIRRRSGLGKAIDFVTDFIPGIGAVKRGVKFIGGLMPDNPNGPGGGNYGIGGLNDAQKEAYNSLAAAGGLFQGPSGMKTLTGKNFNLSDKAFGDYMSNQRNAYNDFAAMTPEEIEELTPFEKLQYKEASALFADKIAKEKELQLAEKNRLAGLIGTTGTDPNTGTSSIIQGEGGGNTPGTSRASDHGKAAGLGHNAGNVRSANAKGTGSAQGYNQNLRSGGRAGYFFGGRVNFKNGGLASIL